METEQHQSLKGFASLPRALSKLGFCSRTQAEELIKKGDVLVNNRPAMNPKQRVHLSRDKITVKGKSVKSAEKIYIILNKPAGYVTTRVDEKGRQNVFQLLSGFEEQHLSAVGRLDMASEGLLFLTNDTEWANWIMSPASHVEKTYHAQIDRHPDESFLSEMRKGVKTENDILSVKHVKVLRLGDKNAWLEITLDEGKNRQIRRLLEAMGTTVRRLIRVKIGPVVLGDLQKGEFRSLNKNELHAISSMFFQTRKM